MADDYNLFRNLQNNNSDSIPDPPPVQILSDLFNDASLPNNNDPILISSGSSSDNNTPNPIRPGRFFESSSGRQFNVDTNEIVSNTNQNQQNQLQSQYQRHPINYSRDFSRTSGREDSSNSRTSALLGSNRPNRNADPPTNIQGSSDVAPTSSQHSRRYPDPNIIDYQWSGPPTNHQFVSIPFQADQVTYTYLPPQQPLLQQQIQQQPPQQQAASHDNQLNSHHQMVMNESRLQQQQQYFRGVDPPQVRDINSQRHLNNNAGTDTGTVYSNTFLTSPSSNQQSYFGISNNVFRNVNGIPGYNRGLFDWSSMPQSLFNSRMRNRSNRAHRTNIAQMVEAYERRRGDRFLSRGFSRPPATIDLTDEVTHPSPMSQQEIKQSIETRSETNQDIKFLDAKTCSVCLATWKELLLDEKSLVFLRCGHIFCRDCAKQFSTTGRRECPNCRKTLLNCKPPFRRLHIPLDPRLMGEKRKRTTVVKK